MLSDLKAQSEAMILRANDIDELSTCALRCSNVFGPGDSELVPLILKLGRSGWAKVGSLSHHLFLWLFEHWSLGGYEGGLGDWFFENKCQIKVKLKPFSQFNLLA